MASSLRNTEERDTPTSSSSTSPAPPDNEESDFFLGNNDSTSSLGVPNFQDMAMEDPCWPPFNRLPNEILIQIFSKLSSPADLFHCMLTNKRFARNAVDLLWHRPSCTDWKKHRVICQTLGFENPTFSYPVFIKRLNLAAIAENVSDGSVMPLAVCSRVERLTLTNCRGLTDVGLVSLVDKSASLLALDISNDRNITEKSINAIAQHCTRLQGLNISGCDGISNDSMIGLARSCRHIKRLKLNECTQLRDDAILAFAENCPNILEIDLHQCNQIGNDPVTALLSKGKCLRELRLANCELIDDGAFLSLPNERKYEHLRILDLTSCVRLTDVAVETIITAAPRLRNLVLAKCRNITDRAVFAIAELGKNLHYVHLGHCAQITDEGVKRLVSKCNRIRYIDLGCLARLTDDSVKRLAQLPKLKRIGLVKCSNITDESVLALADAAFRPRRRDLNSAFAPGDPYTSSLERVHLSYCINLTLTSIMRLLNSCLRLTHLSLTGVAAFQNDAFQPYCRPAPPEFTQHQRDVFCVFSGSMVSKFREFLNTAPQFEDLRASSRQLSSSFPSEFYRLHPRPRVIAIPGAAEGEGLDEEMGDEDNEFEGLDGSEMAVDQPSFNFGVLMAQHMQVQGLPGSAHPLPGHSPLWPHLTQMAEAIAQAPQDPLMPGMAQSPQDQPFSTEPLPASTASLGQGPQPTHVDGASTVAVPTGSPGEGAGGSGTSTAPFSPSPPPG